MNKRLEKLRAAMPEKGIDSILVTHGPNVRYLSGFDGGSDGYLIITGDKAILATDSRYWEQAEREAPDFELFKTMVSYTQWMPELFKTLGIQKLGFEAGSMTFEFYKNFNDALGKAGLNLNLVPVSGIVETIRMTKEPEEIELLQKAAQITDATFNAVYKKLKAGMTEEQVSWEIEKTFHDKGSQGLAFPSIVGSGPNGAMAHAKPSGDIIKNGQPIVIDMGGMYRGYKNDITRTVCTGKPDARFKEIYNIVMEAQQTAAKNIRAGMTGKEADAMARDVIVKAGYGDKFGHSLGHGVGLEEHEQPRLSSFSEQILTDGMVFTIEPGIYITGWGGVRIEETYCMEHGKAVPFNQAIKEDYR